jgi:hypothetical protein
MTDKITINIVDIGFNINEEIQKTLKAEISKETLDDINDVMTAISSKPENKKAVEKVETEKKLEEIIQHILINGKITKDELSKKIPDKNIISIIGLLRNFATKFHNKELIKQKDYYIFVS